MRVIATTGCLIALAACATGNQIANGEPTIAFDSARSPTSERDCIVTAALRIKDLFDYPISPPQVLPIGDGYRITFMNDPRLFAEVTANGAGAHVRYLRLLAPIPPQTGYDRAVRGCED